MNRMIPPTKNAVIAITITDFIIPESPSSRYSTAKAPAQGKYIVSVVTAKPSAGGSYPGEGASQ